jgi:hypothetical protein
MTDPTAKGYTAPQCSGCGYTEEDAKFHLDHNLCSNAGNAPWEVKDSKLPAKAAPTSVEGKAQTFYRKRGYLIKAIRWMGDNLAEVREVYPGIGEEYMLEKGCRVGDWVISPREGRVYFMPDAEFVERYEPKAAPESEDEARDMAYGTAWQESSLYVDSRDAFKEGFDEGWNARARMNAERGR